MRQKFLPFIGTLFVLVGCAPKMQKPLQICPGKNSTTEALTALQSQSQNMVSLYARGKCRLQYYDEKKKKRKENLDIRILVKSPVEIYLRGDLSLLSKAVILGSNKSEFWLAARPKEISTYWWGYWSDLDSSQNLLINPKTILEALGISEIDMQADWSLSNEGPFDILTKREQGVVIQKVFIYCCEYSIRIIEYFDLDGQIIACAELDEYKNITENFFVPSRIKVTTFGQSKEDSISIDLNLRSITPREMTEKQNQLFNPIPTEGFKHIFRLIDDRLIKQPQ